MSIEHSFIFILIDLLLDDLSSSSFGTTDKLFFRLAVTSRPILVILNKVDLLRGDFAIGQQKEEELEITLPASTYDGNNVRTPEAKLSFKKKLLQRKRDSLLDVEENSTGSLETPIVVSDLESMGAGANAVIDGNPIKSVVNTDYSEYKDEFNELESENER